MKVIFEDRSRQYTVKVGDVIAIDKMPGIEEGKEINFDKVLMLTNESAETTFGAPYLKSSSVKAVVVDNNSRDKKVVVFKFKRRKNYKRTLGHKAHRTIVKIEEIKA